MWEVVLRWINSTITQALLILWRLDILLEIYGTCLQKISTYHLQNFKQAVKTKLEVHQSRIKKRPKHTKNWYSFTSSGISCDELGVGSREMSCALPLQIKNTVGLKHRGIYTKRPTLVFFLVPTKPVLWFRVFIPDPESAFFPSRIQGQFRIPDSEPHQRVRSLSFLITRERRANKLKLSFQKEY